MKKKIAIAVWEKIEPVLNKNRDLFIKGDPYNQKIYDWKTQTPNQISFLNLNGTKKIKTISSSTNCMMQMR
jgi:hypothetical protein